MLATVPARCLLISTPTVIRCLHWQWTATVYFQNTGSSTAPAFATSTSNPFGITDVGYNASPVFADLDGDGDLDSFIGEYNGNTVYFDNTGSSSAPAFAASTSNPFGITDVGRYANPVFADLDGDGDLDAFIGNYYGQTVYFQNTGSSAAPAFAASSSNPFGITGVSSYASPVFADLDGDGDLMPLLAITTATPFISKTPAHPPHQPLRPPPAIHSGSQMLALRQTGFADLDADGDLDAFIGNNNGNTGYFQNPPTSIAPTAGSSLNVSNNGGTTAIAAATLSLLTSVSAINDAPVNTVPGPKAPQKILHSPSRHQRCDVDETSPPHRSPSPTARSPLTSPLVVISSNSSADLTLSGSESRSMQRWQHSPTPPALTTTVQTPSPLSAPIQPVHP